MTTSQRAAMVALLAALLLGAAAAPGSAGPQLVPTPRHLAFSPDGGSRVVMLHNRGDAPLHLTALAFSADSAGFSAAPLLPRVLLPGQALPVTVTYVRTGARPQGFGAILFYSDDPSGFDDPRSEERDYVRSVALTAGSTTATVWLWLPPLLAAGLLLLSRRVGQGALIRPLQWAGTLPPLLASLWLLWHFDPGFSVPDGNYGIQLGLHRALWPARGVEIFTGLDGLSLPLVLLLSAASALRLLMRSSEPAADYSGAAAWLLLHGGSLLALCALDAGWLLAGWELLLLGATGRLAAFGHPQQRLLGRWGFFLCTQLGVLLLAAALWQLRGHSLPTALVDGTTVSHTADLVKLGYLNYFGDLTLGGLRLDRCLWAALTLGVLSPVVLLPAMPAPLGERLWLSLPLLVLGVAALVRLPFLLLPQASAALGPWLAGAAVAWAVAFTLRALRKKSLPQLLSAALAARAGGIFVGLLAMTQTGVQAALLQLWHHGLAVVLLALLAASSQRRAAYRAGRVCAVLLITDAPGMLGFVQRTLLVLGAFPGSRLATLVLTAAGVVVAMAALRLLLATRKSARPCLGERLGREVPTRELALVVGVGGLATVLGVWTQPLIGLSQGFASDFVSHVFSHLDQSAIAQLGF